MKDLLFAAAHFVIVGAILLLVFRFANRRLVNYFEARPQQAFRRQLYQVAGILVGVLFVLLLMPFDDELRGDLLNLYGLIITATIALSSTTLVGNILAGITLKIIGNCRPGDYITVGDHFGRVTEMDLIHTEIQTEERDLTTLPNLYLVQNPVRVMRSSGTLLSVELSLGYEVSRHDVEDLLKEAAASAGLESPFVQIRNLGDHSVTYRICGLLKDVKNLLAKRRELRARTIDALHSAGIEIVSPTFLNTRAFDKDQVFVADVGAERQRDTIPDDIVFDKARKAESVENLKKSLDDTLQQIKACDKRLEGAESDAEREAAQAEKTELEERRDRLRSIIDRKGAKIAGD